MVYHINPIQVQDGSIVHYNDAVEAANNATHYISDLSHDQLKELDMGDGEKMLSLSEALDLIKLESDKQQQDILIGLDFKLRYGAIDLSNPLVDLLTEYVLQSLGQ